MTRSRTLALAAAGLLGLGSLSAAGGPRPAVPTWQLELVPVTQDYGVEPAPSPPARIARADAGLPLADHAG